MRSSGPVLQAIGFIVNDWQLSGIWTASTAGTYAVGFSYQNGGGNVNLTGSPDYGGRVRIVGDVGGGCSSDPYRQFNTAAFQGPLIGSVGLESGNSYLHGCFAQALDLSIARNIRAARGPQHSAARRPVQRAEPGGITGRNTTLQLSNPSDPVTNVAPVFDPITGTAEQRRQPDVNGRGESRSLEAEERRLRRGERLSGAAQHADSGEILVLMRRSRMTARVRRVRRSSVLVAAALCHDVRPSVTSAGRGVLAAGAATGVGGIAGPARRTPR